MSKNELIAGTVPAGALVMHVIILGKTRSGKSSKARLIVEHCLERGQPVGIIDPKGDWWGIKLSKTGKSPGFPIIIFGGEHADVKINEHSGKMVADLVCAGNRPFLIDLGGWMPSKRTKFFVDFASTFFIKTRGQRVLMIDEVHNFAPQGKVLDPEAGKALHWANRLASEGGGKGITLISASQRPQKVHKDYVTSHETLIACKVIHKLDRDAVKDWIDGCGDPEQGKEVFKTLGTLPKPEAWVWSPEINFGPKLVTFPFFKTYDSFKPQEAGAVEGLKGWATVDLVEVNEKMAAVIAQEDANDPVKLKAALAAANAKIASLEKQKPAEGVDPRVVESARKEAYEAGEADAAPIWFRRGVEHMAQHIAQLSQPEIITYGLKQFKAVGALAPFPAKRTIVTQPPMHFIPPKNVIAPSPPAVKATPSDGLTTMQQGILDAIAWAGMISPSPPSRMMVAFLASSSPKSSTFEKYVSMLKSAGYLVVQNNSFTLTEAGQERARRPDAPPSHDGMMALISQKLTAGQLAIVNAAVAVYPNTISRDDLATAAGSTPTSSTFEKYLSQMKSLGLVEQVAPKVLKASDQLFPGGF